MLRNFFVAVLAMVVLKVVCLNAGEVSLGKIKVTYDKTAELTISYGDTVVVKHLYYYFRDESESLNISVPSFRGFSEPVQEKLYDEAGNEKGVAVKWNVIPGSDKFMKGLADGEQFVKLYLTKDEVKIELNLIPSNANLKGYGEIGLLLPEETFAGGSYKGIYVSGSGQETPRSGDLPEEREPKQPNTKVFKSIEIETGKALQKKLLLRIEIQNYKKIILQDFRGYETAPWAGNWRIAAGMDNPLGKDVVIIEFEEK